MKKNFFILIAICLLQISCKSTKQNVADINAADAQTVKYATTPDITEDDIRWHISALASDSMQGRQAGTPFEPLAADYIKEQFKSIGLKAFDNNYLQSVPVYSRKTFTDCKLSFEGFEGNYPTDFRSMIMFDSITVSGEVVFAGYGYNVDYTNLDVKGKWVMILEENNGILYERKATAKEKGASGVLAIAKNGTTGDERYVMPSDSTPMIKVSHNLSNNLLAHAGTTVQEILDKTGKGENPIFSIPIVVNSTIKSSTNWLMSQNVVGYIETGDSANEKDYIVIGGHYDHVGARMVDNNMQIYNGADDNASGVAGVMELAEKLISGKKLKYNVIFIAFGAEEMGLIGSRFFCNNPTVPLEKIKLMVNLDMIGRMDSNNRVFINTVKSTEQFNPTVDEIKKLYPDLDVSFTSDSMWQGSDHTSFFNKKIPAIFFTTGMHNDYHKPTDTVDSINYNGEKQLLDFVYEFILLFAK